MVKTTHQHHHAFTDETPKFEFPATTEHARDVQITGKLSKDDNKKRAGSKKNKGTKIISDCDYNLKSMCCRSERRTEKRRRNATPGKRDAVRRGRAVRLVVK